MHLCSDQQIHFPSININKPLSPPQGLGEVRPSLPEAPPHLLPALSNGDDAAVVPARRSLPHFKVIPK